MVLTRNCFFFKKSASPEFKIKGSTINVYNHLTLPFFVSAVIDYLHKSDGYNLFNIKDPVISDLLFFTLNWNWLKRILYEIFA